MWKKYHGFKADFNNMNKVMKNGICEEFYMELFFNSLYYLDDFIWSLYLILYIYIF